MRKAVRAIIIHNNKLLVMHRNKFGVEYDTLPGGNIEVGETLEQAVVREVDEETSLQITNLRLVFIEEAGDPFGTQYIFLCDYVSGTPRLKPDSEEALINKLGQNLYEPKWIELDDLASTKFVSERLKEAVMHGNSAGFPTQPVQIR